MLKNAKKYISSPVQELINELLVPKMNITYNYSILKVLYKLYIRDIFSVAADI